MITAILDHRTDLDLVGVKVYSETKHGKDVGRDPVGVRATADTAEVIAMPADCVIYTPRPGSRRWRRCPLSAATLDSATPDR
jgi:hypothetical protein